MKNKYLFLITILVFLISCNSEPEIKNIEVNIIPQPYMIVKNDGAFELKNKVKIYHSDNEELTSTIKFLQKELSLYGLDSKTKIHKDSRVKKNSIVLKIDSLVMIGEESYRLTINEKGIEILAATPAGIFYGFQTLKQLFPVDYNSDKIFLPFVVIKDSPRFEWRGMHLDVCRHFMPPEFVKKYIDYLASMKMNRFHWHLTDDQGWRIEIKAYPNLTQTGAWRNETRVGHARDSIEEYDKIKHGGFYTQEEIKEIVKYAQDRFITVIPEIEMPGHAQAAIASYPFLGCTDDTVEVWTNWGVSPYIFNVKDTTFKFLETVLSEVCELFPGKYIHIGGDEAPKDQWIASDEVQYKIKELGLKDEHELQSYFITRIEKFVNSKGKVIIGWDEILEGGLAPNAVVMSWRGTEGGIEAAKAQHYVIMSPGSHCYFDHYQTENKENEPLAIGGFTDVEKVYSFEPVPEELSVDERKYILGAQANVWTEYILSPEHVEYMIFPRMIALAEVLWTQPENKNYDDFLKRLSIYKAVLERDSVNYAKHVFEN